MAVDNDEQWNRNAAFSCLDKALFREKMLYACVVGDTTIAEMENALSGVAMLSWSPSDAYPFYMPPVTSVRVPGWIGGRNDGPDLTANQAKNSQLVSSMLTP